MSDDAEVGQLQAAVGGIVLADRKIGFLGREFRVAEKVGLMPLMKFAHAASSGLDTSDMEALGAIYGMLQDCIHPDEWPEFERHAIAEKADAEDLLPVVQQTVEVLTARPTSPPSDSLSQPAPMSRNSTVSSSSPVEAEFIG